MELISVKKTRLEMVEPSEISGILELKVKELEEKNAPVEAGLADYIALGLQNIDEEIEKLTNYKKMLDEKIKEMKTQKTQISEKIAEWLESNGIDKLKGVIVSSVTIKPEKKGEKKKFVLDVSQEKLVEMGVAHYEFEPTYTPKQVKINKRRNNGTAKTINGNSSTELLTN